MAVRIVLASSSPYRAELLARLGLVFASDAPEIDESRHAGEAAPDYVERLAREKAAAVAARHPGALVIGSDQCSERGGEILGKPHTAERAVEQLSAAAGGVVTLWTGVALLDGRRGTTEARVVPFRVHFRALSRHAIERYVARDQPLDCAGAFRAEGLGITLFERLEGDDPNALIGLPLIALTDLLHSAGVSLP
ncbi:Maf family protein [Spiribacter halobius]|uniref:7-methyl-GTP pyrophosphatase n=1 Tax=Sediminicurvatus halobius TaxID=2182432 RepID=A0A2U2N1X7_9GAMM|nr:nucleoside triphosphate pyrophosphatase [Spiribacter halobius]PWG63235.1 septum formation inhibitor Maf [Spiribacter halobius]UEX76694.1 Maf family nucleotide pyrophosphatase [Spiribacter halobius]